MIKKNLIRINFLFFIFIIISQVLLYPFLIQEGKLWLSNFLIVEYEKIIKIISLMTPYILLSFFLKKSINSNIILALSALPLFILIETIPLGDNWQYQTDVQPNLWLSEVFGSLYAKAYYQWGYQWISYIVKPLIGSFSIYLMLSIIDDISKQANDKTNNKILTRSIVISSPWVLTIYQGNGDVIFFAIPAVLILIKTIYDLWQSQKIDSKAKLIASASFTFSIFSHMGALILSPAIIIVLALKKRFYDIFVIYGLIILISLTTVLLLKQLDLAIIMGNVGEHSIIFSIPQESRVSFESVEYLARGANILSIAFPLFFLFVITMAIDGFRTLRRDNSIFPLLLCSNAYFCFIYMVNFHFGFYSDIDLMIYLSPIFIITAITIIIKTEQYKIIERLKIPISVLSILISVSIQTNMIN